jgi:formate-dependent nitrite reductase membrane component NrfD
VSEREEPVRTTWAAHRTERPGTPATGGPTMAAADAVPFAPAGTTRSSTGAGERRRRRDGALVPPARPTSYYGRPVIKPPPWEAYIPVYFFFGGLAGASAALAAGAHVAGNEALERRAWAVSLAGLAVSPPLLIADLGRPERFLNMLRVFKVTSPMSLGSWILSATSGAVGVAGLSTLTGRVPWAARLAAVPAGALGTTLATYTAGLLADTSVPAWLEARRELPFVFGGSAMASAGGAALILTPLAHAEPARRLLLAGAAVETVASRVMEHRLGALAAPYRTGRSGALARAALTATAAGAGLALASGASRRGRARRSLAIAAGALTMAGSALERFAVFEAGLASARDPAATIEPQRRRLGRQPPSESPSWRQAPPRRAAG